MMMMMMPLLQLLQGCVLKQALQYLGAWAQRWAGTSELASQKGASQSKSFLNNKCFPAYLGLLLPWLEGWVLVKAPQDQA